MLLNRYLACFVLIFSTSCRAHDGPAVDWGTMSTNDLFEMRTTACYGSCPIYRVRIFADGEYLFEGINFTQRNGTYHGQLSAETLAALTKQIRSLDFEPHADGSVGKCEEQYTDNPGVIFRFQINGTMRRIGHNLGCHGFSGASRLQAFEKKIADILPIQGGM